MGLKGLFIKEEEQQQQEKPKEVAPTVASVMPTQTPTIITGTGEVDKEISGYLILRNLTTTLTN